MTLCAIADAPELSQIPEVDFNGVALPMLNASSPSLPGSYDDVVG